MIILDEHFCSLICVQLTICKWIGGTPNILLFIYLFFFVNKKTEHKLDIM